ncbi:uncharacterized protein Dwil_GK27995 [Drosophila willistoni]|uniref:Uncharacterized protein n=1 Tax=Drosophila willistoni TaxID=7260 RepID=A0A0Q9WSQ7_DROWI|nr:uncharacterized protein Dwil_GK27995 [Drosophila willistoni]
MSNRIKKVQFGASCLMNKTAKKSWLNVEKCVLKTERD